MRDALLERDDRPRRVTPGPAWVFLSGVMFVAGFAGACIAVVADKLVERFMSGR